MKNFILVKFYYIFNSKIQFYLFSFVVFSVFLVKMSEEPNEITTEPILDENTNEKTEQKSDEIVRNEVEKPNSHEEYVEKNVIQTENQTVYETLVNEKKEETSSSSKKEAPSS